MWAWKDLNFRPSPYQRDAQARWHVHNAMQSIAYYLAYLQDPLKNKDKLQKIIDYNEDDVRAMVVVRQWLAAHP